MKHNETMSKAAKAIVEKQEQLCMDLLKKHKLWNDDEDGATNASRISAQGYYFQTIPHEHKMKLMKGDEEVDSFTLEVTFSRGDA